jgi:hypothetical protein
VKVKYLVSMAGTHFVRSPGDPGEVDDAEGARLVAAGFAEEVEDEPGEDDGKPKGKPKKKG